MAIGFGCIRPKQLTKSRKTTFICHYENQEKLLVQCNLSGNRDYKIEEVKKTSQGFASCGRATVPIERSGTTGKSLHFN